MSADDAYTDESGCRTSSGVDDRLASKSSRRYGSSIALMAQATD
jgi:hypothetical protein